MSRLAKKPIPVPENVEIEINGGKVTVKGPLGVLSREFPVSISIAREEGGIKVTPKDDTAETKMLVGTVVSHLSNMIAGSREPFVKKLIVEGIGFKADVKGQEITLSLGFSHLIKVKIPADLKVISEKNVVTVSGSNIESVGQFAARIRSLKKPEPYKGKGIRYDSEVIRRKQGKKTT